MVDGRAVSDLVDVGLEGRFAPELTAPKRQDQATQRFLMDVRPGIAEIEASGRERPRHRRIDRFHARRVAPEKSLKDIGGAVVMVHKGLTLPPIVTLEPSAPPNPLVEVKGLSFGPGGHVERVLHCSFREGPCT
jgi:hypothetical protein